MAFLRITLYDLWEWHKYFLYVIVQLCPEYLNLIYVVSFDGNIIYSTPTYSLIGFSNIIL